MYPCFRCEKKSYERVDNLGVHWSGTTDGRTRAERCPAKNFYQSDGVTSKWRRFIQKAEDVNNPKRRIRNTRYSWEPEPKGWTQAELRDKALEVLDSVVRQIEKREVSPFQYTTGKRSRDMAEASDEQEAKLEDMSDEMLADERSKLEKKIAVDEAKLQVEKQRLEFIRRLQERGSGGGEVPPAKRPRCA